MEREFEVLEGGCRLYRIPLESPQLLTPHQLRLAARFKNEGEPMPRNVPELAACLEGSELWNEALGQRPADGRR